jgi:glucose/arabinose dehydrogenase
MRRNLNLSRGILPSLLCGILILAAHARAQLPDDLKSDLGPNVPAFKVRPGYRVTRAVAPDALRWSRFLQFSADGKTLYVSGNERQRFGSIYALRDPDANGVFTRVTTFVPDKSSVQGMAIHDGWLYYSQAGEGSVERARDTNGDGVADEVQVVLPRNSVPAGGGHPFEGLLVTDKEIYITASDPTNFTPALDSDRKKIYVFDIDGKDRREFASGIRNTEKLRFRPGTTEIWGFDHGSDNFGQPYGERTGQNQPITDLNPNEEFNHYVEGAFYGHPYIMGNGVPRPDTAKLPGINIVDLAAKTTAPEWLVHAHWAVLGFTFIEKDYFPGTQGDCFFASHGSWNSVKPVGAVIQRIMFDQVTGHPYGSQTIVDCQVGARRLARPVDLAEAPDGTLLFSCDEPTPALYRISKSN